MKKILQEYNILKFLTFVILALITVIVVHYIGLYREVGPELLVNGDFRNGLESWIRTDRGGSVVIEDPLTVSLRSDKMDAIVSIQQVIDEPQRFKFLTLSGDIKTRDIKVGSKAWHKGKLTLGSYDKDDRWIPILHNVASFEGSSPWKHYSKVFKIVPKAERLRVAAQLYKSTGTMWVKNLSLREAVKKPFYRYWRFFYFLWFVFLIWLIAPLIAYCKGFVLKGIATLTVLVILFGVLMPGSEKLRFEEGSTVVIKNVIEKKTSEHDNGGKLSEKEWLQAVKIWRMMNKAGHFILFGVFALNLSAGFTRERQRFIIMSIMLFAGATELMQYFVEYRSPLVRDWLVDVSGAAAGIFIYYLACKCKEICKGKCSKVT
jgi:VanZ family protein